MKRTVDSNVKLQNVSQSEQFTMLLLQKINKDGPFAATISLNNTYLPVCAI